MSAMNPSTIILITDWGARQGFVEYDDMIYLYCTGEFTIIDKTDWRLACLEV